MAASVPKKRKLSIREAGKSTVSAETLQKDFYNSASTWNLEENYQKRQAKKQKSQPKESTRLPIKTADGRIEQVEYEDEQAADSEEDWLEEKEERPERPAKKKPEKSETEQIIEAQEELAKIANTLNQDPEENAGAFRALAKIGESDILAIRKLALITQMTVYKDVIPGYRIRPAAEAVVEEKLTKDVRRMRSYEQSLLAGYQAYVRNISQLARSRPSWKDKGQTLPSIATTCACSLLNSVPHFNFRSDLIKILVAKLSRRRVDGDFIKCQKAIEKLFDEDEDGGPSHDVVSTLSRMMKARDYDVDERVVNVFLHLRLLSEFSGKASLNSVEDEDGAKALERDAAQTDALVHHEERERLQSEALKLVFATYFRILKLRAPHLMGAVLEGLAKYAHLINQDFFGDLLEALKDLIRYADADEAAIGNEDDEGDAAKEDEEDEDEENIRNASREALLCTITAFALLAGQGAHNSRTALHLDLSFFNNHLYRSLHALSTNPDLELTSRTHLPDPSKPVPPPSTGNKVNLQTTTVLLQLMTAALHLPEKSCRAILALLSDVADTHGKKVSGLWNTEHRIGNGTFNALADNFESSNPFAATVWEGEILRKHFSPMVREGVKLLEKGMSK
ncbi:unnamed protein product [Parascedosporium putredinis]|uniref:Nucleolar complex-associated protein 3 n=1 Tax=Parascedosporium putredinis TaxID=1442378 RepID=A0A9P1HA31_9PEZI|nr:unnamed protein product [Parascedosporium putredinis]CAI8002424.1 unnamed protein product [Parascedosporium putredinis]